MTSLVKLFPGADVRNIPNSDVDSIGLGQDISEFEKRLQKERTYALKVVSISPAQGLLEHQPIQIQYQLVVGQVGIRGELLPKMMHGLVCPASNKGSCSTISDLQPSQTFTGTVDAFAPSAGAAASIRIKLVTDASCPAAPNCFGETMLATNEEFMVPVAARYEIAIDSFDLQKPRSKNKDTVKMSLRSGLQERPIGEAFCHVFGGHFCTVNVLLGDFGTALDPVEPDFGPHNEPHVIVTNVRVGSFDLIPEVSNNLVFQYDVENLGHEKKTVVDSISQAAAGILDALVTNSDTDTLGSFAAKIQGLEGCDGPVAVDGKLILNKSDPHLPGVPTLDSLTREKGRFTPTRTRFDGTDSAVGCGDNSRYQVTWSILRTSWEP